MNVNIRVYTLNTKKMQRNVSPVNFFVLIGRTKNDVPTMDANGNQMRAPLFQTFQGFRKTTGVLVKRCGVIQVKLAKILVALFLGILIGVKRKGIAATTMDFGMIVTKTLTPMNKNETLKYWQT